MFIVSVCLASIIAAILADRRRWKLTRFRLVECVHRLWSCEFEAAEPEELRLGVMQAWDAHIVAHRHPAAAAVDPAWALTERLQEIDRWLQDRLAREDTTEQQRRSWQAQAHHWRYQAEVHLGKGPLLELQVFGPASGRWLTPVPGKPVAPAVPRNLDHENARFLFAGSRRMVEYDAELCGLAGRIARMAMEELRQPPAGPTLSLVPPEDEGPT